MNSQTGGILWEATTVAVIVVLTRWLLGEGQREQPRVFQDLRVYGVRRRLQIAGYGAVAVFAILAIAFHNEFTSRGGLWLLMIPIGFGLLGIWVATGLVITNDREITKKGFFVSRSIAWERISGVCLYERQRYIEVRAENEKLSIDRRFVAHQDLLDEIHRHSPVQLEKK